MLLNNKVRHEVVHPLNYEYTSIKNENLPEKPSREYKFKLDPFQKYAINCIERNESALVSAHTSAGKTVVAEYAIAKALQNRQRVVYTSPIKALSNQKYRDFVQEFGDVGLITGDITINPNASCLVMTTEILRTMLYRKNDVVKEASWIIFDEIHYMQDIDRGVVWEEAIIIVPSEIRFIFLSATIPNATQFAEWVCKIHKQPCHVISTDYRPTPLQHYLFPINGSGIYIAVDEEGEFHQDNYYKVMNLLETESESKLKKWKNNSKDFTDILNIVKMIISKNYQPAIVFSFSKKDCEIFAIQLSKFDFNDDHEKNMIDEIFKNATATLSDEDTQLHQIQNMLPLLKRGIGIHHSGLLPLLKEIIEILFQEGLVKVLFATETFSIGLNMPAKTVVFSKLKKFDGSRKRWLTSGEYIQMSGRAGRRGLDDFGIVILMLDEKIDSEYAKDMIKGSPNELKSAFHIRYSMILNLLLLEPYKPEVILEKSFYQYQNRLKEPSLEKNLKNLQNQYSKISIENEESIEEYYNIYKQLEIYKEDFKSVINHPVYILPFLQPGRLVHIKINHQHDLETNLDDNAILNEESNTIDDDDFGWGILINFQKCFTQIKGSDVKSEFEGNRYIIDVLLLCKQGTEKDHLEPKPCEEGEKSDAIIVPCDLSSVEEISSLRVFLPNNLKNLESRNQMAKVISEITKNYQDGIPLLDPIEDLKINDSSFDQLIKKIQILEEKLFKHPLHDSPDIKTLYEQYDKKMVLNKKIKYMKKKIGKIKNILKLDELKYRKRVLRRLGFLSSSEILELKGRVACEIQTGDELVITEMIFDGVFNDLTIPQVISILSCVVLPEKEKEDYLIRKEMRKPYKQLTDIVKKVLKISIESKLEIDEEKYIESFRKNLINAMYAWGSGEPFANICKLSELYEGSIIKVIKSIDELLQQLVKAAHVINNIELENKFKEAIKQNHRGIAFSASLYL
ncbi:antiviral helicase [Anaeromyces robustus]|uniref:Antiviral helicase n=1 Tax=Anaeromyces robustus TaxID=1754192 RepID=A0A1Y1XL87_9FUNG|nr:antiviral helicase [Anaeromyces robustus]|eukprot:ORX86527.1 antiviral helicase [Anaeromyces robustus]